MSLQVSLTSVQQSSCDEWVFTDSTGAYSSSNTTGWGTPNWEVNDGTITVATLSIARHDGTDFVTLGTIDIINGLGIPFDNTTTLASLVYTITSADIGTIDDGVYQVTYTVGNGTTTSTVTYNLALYCKIECCIEQRLANVPTEYSCVTCSNSYLEVTMTLWTLLQALKLAACTASIAQFQNILTTLQTACEQAGTSCS